jgi:protein-tyrosine sulfotransferase
MIGSAGKNLIFLVSAPRAGSTLVAAMLGTHPGIESPPEPWIQLPLSTFDGMAGAVDAPFDHPLAIKAIAEVWPEQERLQAKRKFSEAFYNERLRLSGKRILIDKTPRYFHILPQLELEWPEARFIWLTRNPLDIVASCRRSWGIGIKEQMGIPITPHSYDTTASFERMAEFFSSPGPRRIHVSYENLVAAPESDLKRLCAFIGVHYSHELIEYGSNRSLNESYRNSGFGDKSAMDHKSPHAQSINRWKTDLSPVEVSFTIRSLGRECFARQGYEQSLKEACDFAGISIEEISSTGSWRDNLSKRARRGGAHFLAQRQLLEVQEQFDASEKDRVARGRFIEQQGKELSKLEAEFDKRLKELAKLHESADVLRNERNLIQAQLADLQNNFDAAERDRVARGRFIEEQGARLSSLEKEHDSRLKELARLHELAEALKNERNLLKAQLADLKNNFDGAESDRLARGKVIEDQGARLSALEKEHDSRLKQLTKLQRLAEVLKSERNLLLAQLAGMKSDFVGAEKERAERAKFIEQQDANISDLEKQHGARLKDVGLLQESTEVLKNERNLLEAQLADLKSNFDAVERDRIARGDTIEQQGGQLSRLEAEFHKRLNELSALQESAEFLRNERNLLWAQLTDLKTNFDSVERDRAARGKLIEKLGEEQSRLEAEFDKRLKELSALHVAAEGLKNERNLLHAQFADLKASFDSAERDRVARGEVIEQQGRKCDEFQALIALTETDRDAWKGFFQSSQSQLHAIQAELERTHVEKADLAVKLHKLQEFEKKWWFRLARRVGRD